MRGLLFIFVLLLPALAGADVYKWFGPDGRIHYSDRRVSGAERIGIQVDRNIPAQTNKLRAGGEGADPGLYNAFEIVEPESTETLRDADGKLGLALLIDPPLSAEHRLQILLDGQPLPGDVAGTQILLQGLSYGSHRVQALIRDDLEEIVASSSLVHFHMRKPLPESP
jgi:hypothetical protein